MSRFLASFIAVTYLLPLLLAVPACATTIDVHGVSHGAGTVVVADDGQCSLREAIDLAQGNIDNDDCTAVNDGEYSIKTLVLPTDATFTLSEAQVTGAVNGLPQLFSDQFSFIIKGNGSTITRSTANGTPEFRLMDVSGVALELRDLTLSHGYLSSGQGGCISAVGPELTLDHVTVSHCYALRAGGIKLNGGSLVIRNGSVVSNNVAANAAGGIEASGTLTLSSSTVSDNTSQYFGAGIMNEGTADITDSTVSGNVSHSDAQPASATGGGIYSSGTLTVVNTTISGNQAYEGAGLMLTNAGSEATIVDSTVSGNIAEHDGAGLYINAAAADIYASVIAAPSGQTPAPSACALESGGSLSSSGFNLDNDGSCGFTETGDISATDPMLGPLVGNGGPTLTLLPEPASPLIDRRLLADCASNVPIGTGIDVSEDQRGTARPIGAGCDIGAVEAPQLVASLTRYGGFDQHTMSGDPFEQPLVVQAFDLRGKVVAGALFALQAPTSGASASCDLSAATDATGVALIYCTANAMAGSYTVSLAPAAGFGLPGASNAQSFDLTNDFNDRIFGDGFDGSPLVTTMLAAGQSVADLAVPPPRGLLVNHITPILVVKDQLGRRVALVEARRGADGVLLRIIRYAANGQRALPGVWQVAGNTPRLHLRRNASGILANIR